MQPLNRINLSENSEDHDRIGPNKRNSKLSNYRNIEKLMDHFTPLTMSFDISPHHPPYFNEFTYVDILDGITILTQSAEINARLSAMASRCHTDMKFPIDEVIDKYELKTPEKQYKKVIFLPALSAFRMIDLSKLQKLMYEDKEWVIKLHPVSEDEFIRSLAGMFGYHRLIDGSESGMSILKSATVMAASDTSELLILARLLNKPAINLTSYVNGWQAAYHSIGRLIKNDDDDLAKLTNLFMSNQSGHIRSNYEQDNQIQLMVNYFESAMREREKFKMVTNQELHVSDKMIQIGTKNV